MIVYERLEFYCETAGNHKGLPLPSRAVHRAV